MTEMTESSPNPDDPEFLLSRSLDEDLSDEERRRLEKELAASDSLQEAQRHYARLNELLRLFAVEKLEVDWDAFAANVEQASVSVERKTSQNALDELLARWARGELDVNWERFTAEVMGRIEQKPSAVPWHRMIFRIGGPLAAAAAIVLAVLVFQVKRTPEGRSNVVYEGPTGTLVEGNRVSRVSYGRQPDGLAAIEPRSSAFGYATIGTAVPTEEAAVPPL
jgi:hypothetical protein